MYQRLMQGEIEQMRLVLGRSLAVIGHVSDSLKVLGCKLFFIFSRTKILLFTHSKTPHLRPLLSMSSHRKSVAFSEDTTVVASNGEVTEVNGTSEKTSAESHSAGASLLLWYVIFRC